MTWGKKVNHPVALKQCKECKFTMLFKMFGVNHKSKDGYSNICKRCRPRPWMGALLLLLICSSASAQEPEHLGDTYVRAAMVLMQPNASEAAIYLDKGFGTHPIALVATINWKLTVGADPYKYALFRIRDGGAMSDDYWVTERATWTAYQSHKNVATLKAASWQFGHFTLDSDYEVPSLPFPVVWTVRTPDLTVGYSRGCTIPVVRSADGLSWEWTIRGAKALSTWEFANTREEAMLAAAEAIDDL